MGPFPDCMQELLEISIDIRHGKLIEFLGLRNMRRNDESLIIN